MKPPGPVRSHETHHSARHGTSCTRAVRNFRRGRQPLAAQLTHTRPGADGRGLLAATEGEARIEKEKKRLEGDRASETHSCKPFGSVKE